jgi:hypothetical protein
MSPFSAVDEAGLFSWLTIGFIHLLNPCDYSPAESSARSDFIYSPHLLEYLFPSGHRHEIVRQKASSEVRWEDGCSSF